MKKIVKIIIISFLIISCSHEEEYNQENSSLFGFKKITYTNANSRNITQILEFDNMDIYQQTLASLEQAVEDWDDAFVNQYDYLNDEDLNDLEEELKFDDEKPLTDFENQNDFYSLRNKFIYDEDNWLNNNILNLKNSPLDYEIYDLDETEMTLVNVFGEVKIGKAIYKKLNQIQIEGINKFLVTPIDGGFIRINNGNFDNLNDFNNGNYSLINQDNFEIISDYPIPCFIVPCDGNNGNDNTGNNSSISTCKKNKKKTKYFSTGNNKKVWAKVKMSGRRAKAKLRSYKKRRRRWKKWRTYMNVKIQGFTKDYNCNWGEAINKSNSGRKKRIKAIKRSTYKRVSQGEMANVLNHNGQNKILFLTW